MLFRSIQQERETAKQWADINKKLGEELSSGKLGAAYAFNDAYQKGQTGDLGDTIGEQFANFSHTFEERQKMQEWADKNARDQERKAVDEQIAADKRADEQRRQFALNPQFAGANAVGSAAEYQSRIRYQFGVGDKDNKKILQDQLNEQQRQTRAIEELARKGVTIITLK